MNLKKLLPALLLGVAMSAFADGYTDGIEYYKAGQYDNARTILNRTLNDASTNKALAYYYLGQLDLRDGNKNAALANFEKGVAADATNPYNYVGLGSVALANNDRNAAEDYFKQAQKLDKKNAALHIEIARAWYNADKVAYANKVQDLIAKAHKDSKDREPAIYVLEGDMIFDTQDPAQLGDAAQQYEMAITYDPTNPEGYVKYANAYMYVNPQYGVQKLEELLQRRPTSALAQRELAEKYYSTRQWTKAAEQYGRYIQNPNHFPEDKARYAVLLFANGDYTSSMAVADELLAADPNNFLMNRIKMLDLAELDRNEEAAALAEKFMSLPDANTSASTRYTPNDFITYGNVLSKLGQDSVAVFQYEKAVEADRSMGDSWKALSTAYGNVNNFQKAAEAFEEYVALQENPSLTDSFQASAQWLRAAGSSDDNVQKMADADKGLIAINRVLQGVEAGQALMVPEFLQRHALLCYIRNSQVPDQATAESLQRLLDFLNSNPDFSDPNNAANRLQMYGQVYFILSQYYDQIDPDLSRQYRNKLSEIQDYVH